MRKRVSRFGAGKSLWRQECMGGEVATSGSVRDGIFYFSNTGAFTGAFSATDGKILFKNEDTPAPDVASAVLYNDLYILFTSGGSVLGIDAKDGKELFEENFDARRRWRQDHRRKSGRRPPVALRHAGEADRRGEVFDEDEAFRRSGALRRKRDRTYRSE